jgi:hypothetical protein
MEKFCNNCILPETYSGLKLNDQGTCNYCEEYEPIDYLGEKRLEEDVSKILANRTGNKYDCIVAFSGGRDSTYLLWYVVKVLKLKTLAVFVDSKLIPEETISNINKTVEQLGVDIVFKKHEYLKKSIHHHLKSWLKYPDPATLINLCSGCRLGFIKYVDEEAVKQDIPIVFLGGTPFEKGLFKRNLISTQRNHSFLFGYAKQVLKNPSLVTNFNSLKIQVNEYRAVMSEIKAKDYSYVKLTPFNNYFRWEEKTIVATIENELGWKQHPGMKSTYRGDCEIGIIRQFFYNKILGYNDKDDHLSWLVRDKQITREEALERVNKEKEVEIDILQESFGQLGIDFKKLISDFERKARKRKIQFVE